MVVGVTQCYRIGICSGKYAYHGVVIEVEYRPPDDATYENGKDRDKRRNRQTLWGECTEANPKLLLNGT